MAKQRRRRSRRSRRSTKPKSMIFERMNYVLLALCVGLIALGFAMMRIDNALEGVISVYISPLIIMAGYIGVIYAIFWRPAQQDKSVQKRESPARQ